MHVYIVLTKNIIYVHSVFIYIYHYGCTTISQHLVSVKAIAVSPLTFKPQV